MKAPLNWINDFVPVKNTDPHRIAHMTTMTGSKVEGVLVTAPQISGVFAGEITHIVKHPKADRLTVCTVQLGNGSLTIVTGATNIKPGDKVPVATAGAVITANKVIQPGELRGVRSEGMLCSAQELDLPGECFSPDQRDGILILPPETVVGTDIRTVFEMGNAVLDFEITSNRPDCFSIIGLSREIALSMDLPFVCHSPFIRESKTYLSANEISVAISDPDLCSRYIARTVHHVTIGPSPQWMVNRLRDAGIRPINNIVDITNYVMIETGQPMHAFDLNFLSDRQINVRRAREGEIITTLDKEQYKLSGSMLVIADSSRPIALAGIMGGENSQINTDTKTILFESASFNGVNVRMTAHQLGIRTESSSRFEKGLSPETARIAIDRACELVQMLECGDVSGDLVDNYPVKPTPCHISFRPERINRFLGTQISEEKMIEILISIGCEKHLKGESICFIPPYFRPDLKEEADLTEEIARFYGYNNINATLLSGKSTTQGGLSPIQKQKAAASEYLRGKGFYEACTYSFYGTKSLDKIQLPSGDILRNAVTLSNPLGENFAIMRTTLLPSLLEIGATNFKRGVSECKIFELAKCYFPNQIKPDELPIESDTLGGMYYHTSTDMGIQELFCIIKGVVNGLLNHLGIVNAEYVACETNMSFHPGRTAKIIYDGKDIGILGEVHPDVIAAFEAPDKTFVFMIDYEAIKSYPIPQKTFRALPRFPGVSRDLAILVDQAVLSGDIMKVIRESAGKFLEEVSFFDIYTGKQIAAGKKSLAYKLIFRSPNETMTDAMVNPYMTCILETLQDRFGAQLR